MDRNGVTRTGCLVLLVGSFAAAGVLISSGARAAQHPGDHEADQASGKGQAPEPIPVTEEALRIHRAAIVIDGHNDLPWRIRTLADSSFDKMDIALPQAKLQTDIPRLVQGGVGAQFWVVYVPPETARAGTATSMALEQFELIHRMVKRYPDVFEMAYTADDVVRIRKTGKIASLIGIEGGHAIENSLETLARFYELGARYLGLTHSETIDWADSATDEPRHGGLSPFGEQVILEMNRLGMLVDLAHVSAETMRDALRVSKAPVITSHSSAYAVAPHARNVPDDVLGMFARNGGVVMVTFFSGYIHPEGARVTANYFQEERRLKEKYPKEEEFEQAWRQWKEAHPIPTGTVATLVDHIDHVVRVAGIDHVGLGGDYEGASIMPERLEDVSGYPYITQELLNRGYSERDIHKILGANLLRALRGAERVARNWKE
jgi:membrane dipeptidase